MLDLSIPFTCGTMCTCLPAATEWGMEGGPKKLLWAEAVGPANIAAHRQNAREHKVTGKGQTEVAESCPAVTVRSGVCREY